MLLKKTQVSVCQSKSVIALCTIWVDHLPTRCKCNQRWELAYLAFDAYAYVVQFPCHRNWSLLHGYGAHAHPPVFAADLFTYMDER